MRPFLYRIPNHVDHANKFIDFIEYESYKKLIFRVDEVEELKRNQKREQRAFLQEIAAAKQSRNASTLRQERMVMKKKEAEIGSDNIYQSKIGDKVDSNLWRGFVNKAGDIYRPKGGITGGNQSPITGENEGNPDFLQGISDQAFERKSRYENLRRKKKTDD